MEEITNNNNTLEKQPLVSIIVITYNSSKYVLETLESAKAQTYQNIELIVSDDCSTDNTVEICREWIEKNKERFVRTELITAEKNSGIPANCNRGVKSAQGEWLKFIAGDDTLKNEAIATYISFISKHEECSLLHSSMEIYKEKIEDKNKISTNYISLITEKINASTQFKLLCFLNQISAPTVIIKKEIINKLGGFDESIPLCEDWPFWLKATQNDFKFYYLNDPTVNYRIHNTSTYSSKNASNALFPSFIKIDKIIFDKYISKNCSKTLLIFWIYKYFIQNAFIKLKMNKNIFFNKFIYKILILPYICYEKWKINSLINNIHLLVSDKKYTLKLRSTPFGNSPGRFNFIVVKQKR
ncbi:MAG: glycosyltransferase [Bacteroidales bacterium]